MSFGIDAVYETFSQQSGIPLFLLREDHPLKLREIIAHFRKQIVGQTEAIEQVAKTVCLVKANRTDVCRAAPANPMVATGPSESNGGCVSKSESSKSSSVCGGSRAGAMGGSDVGRPRLVGLR